jgi:hypothetical protein
VVIAGWIPALQRSQATLFRVVLFCCPRVCCSPNRRPATQERADCLHPFLHRPVCADVFGPDPLEPVWSHLPVPNPVRVNGQPWAPGANTKTGSLGAHHLQAALAHVVLYPFPKFLTFLGRAALGADAQKQMPVGFCHSCFLQPTADFLSRHRGIFSGSGGTAQPAKRTRVSKSLFYSCAC